jgi:hypothetical protein
MSAYDEDSQIGENEKPNIPARTASASEDSLLKFIKLWGVFFRAVFIICIGIFGYVWFDPKPLGDVPISQLTLNDIFNNIYGVGIPIACAVWLFKTPEKDPDYEEHPYESWGKFGGFVVLVAGLWYWYSTL